MHKILLVEDEKILRDAYEILLQSQGKYELTTAPNGQEAVELCRRNTYDLILLDLMMPVLDGVGFLEHATAEGLVSDSRIVIMSNLSSGEEVQKALQMGAHRHAVKSNLAPKEVISIIEEELALGRQNDS